MTKSEQRKMARLEVENATYREEIDKLFSVYRKMLHELVFLRGKRDALNRIATELIDEAAYWPDEFEMRK